MRVQQWLRLMQQKIMNTSITISAMASELLAITKSQMMQASRPTISTISTLRQVPARGVFGSRTSQMSPNIINSNILEIGHCSSLRDRSLPRQQVARQISPSLMSLPQPCLLLSRKVPLNTSPYSGAVQTPYPLRIPPLNPPEYQCPFSYLTFPSTSQPSVLQYQTFFLCRFSSPLTGLQFKNQPQNLLLGFQMSKMYLPLMGLPQQNSPLKWQVPSDSSPSPCFLLPWIEPLYQYFPFLYSPLEGSPLTQSPQKQISLDLQVTPFFTSPSSNSPTVRAEFVNMLPYPASLLPLKVPP